MQTLALARALAQHRAAGTRKPAVLPHRESARPHPLLAAIAREAHTRPRTMVEMARDREAVRRPWQ